MWDRVTEVVLWVMPGADSTLILHIAQKKKSRSFPFTTFRVRMTAFYL
jgi:hypothetical protein